MNSVFNESCEKEKLGSKKKTSNMPIRVNVAEVCDARDDNSSTGDDLILIKQIYVSYSFSVSNTKIQ